MESLGCVLSPYQDYITVWWTYTTVISGIAMVTSDIAMSLLRLDRIFKMLIEMFIFFAKLRCSCVFKIH